MEPLVHLIQALIHRPHWPSTAIAQECRCDPRRVRRYRRLIATSGLDAEHLEGCDAATLNAFFNPRNTISRRAAPDFEQLERQHPGASGRALWEAYVLEQQRKKSPPMSYPHFMRVRLEIGA